MSKDHQGASKSVAKGKKKTKKGKSGQKSPPAKKSIPQHIRVNDMFLGPLERPALAWLVKRLPAWVTPDILTGFGFFATILVAVSYVLAKFSPAFLWLASLGLILNWFGDSLDGSLARYRKIERPKYGFFIDHTVDGLSQVIVFLGLGLSPYVDFRIALIALVGYMLVANLVYIGTAVQGVFRLSYAKIGPTEVRALGILFNTVIFFVGNPIIKLSSMQLSLFDCLMIGLILFFYIGYIVVVLIQAKKLAKQEEADLLLKG